MPVKEDMRVTKTKMSIEKAMLELLEECSLKEITVQNITLVNKYRHLCQFMLYWFHENNKPKNSIF